MSGGSTLAGATALQFTLDTSSLFGADAHLAFDFLNYDPAPNSHVDGIDTPGYETYFHGNRVTINAFFTDGTLGAARTLGGAAGTLSPGPVTLTDTDLFNEFLQPITLGNTVSFTLSLTEHAPSGSPQDAFSFFLLDAPSDPTQVLLPLFATDDPTGADALFQVDIDGTPNGARYPFVYADISVPVTWTLEPVAVAVPLPSTALLLGAGLLGGMAARRRRAPVPS